MNANNAQSNPRDYLAIAIIGAGSSFGRDATREGALDQLRRALWDWDSLYNIAGATVKAGLYDATGFDSVHWDARGTWGGPDGETPVPFLGIETFTMPDKKPRRR